MKKYLCFVIAFICRIGKVLSELNSPLVTNPALEHRAKIFDLLSNVKCKLVVMSFHSYVTYHWLDLVELTTSVMFSMQSIFFQQYACLNKPKHQSGANLVCPTSNDIKVISRCKYTMANTGPCNCFYFAHSNCLHVSEPCFFSQTIYSEVVMEETINRIIFLLCRPDIVDSPSVPKARTPHNEWHIPTNLDAKDHISSVCLSFSQTFFP